MERYIKRCLESLLIQSFKDFEVVVVNDVTPDNSMEIVRAFSEKWRNVTIVEHEKNMGLMWTRRTGYRVAKGDFFVFLDSDDWLPQDALEILVKTIEQTKADIVCGSFVKADDNGGCLTVHNRLDYGETSEYVFKALLKNEFCHNLWGKIYDSALFSRFSYDTFPDFTNGEDGLLFYQILINTSKVVAIPDNVYFYYHNKQSSTKVKYSDRAIESIVILNKYRVKILNGYPRLRRLCERKISSILINLLYSTKKKALLLDLLKKYGLMYYVRNTTILKNHSVIKSVELLVKKYIS